MGSHLFSRAGAIRTKNNRELTKSYKISREEKPATDPLKLKQLKDSGASCNSCAARLPSGLLHTCLIRKKWVKLYNICNAYELKESKESKS